VLLIQAHLQQALYLLVTQAAVVQQMLFNQEYQLAVGKDKQE
jgi:hypothetical protein